MNFGGKKILSYFLFSLVYWRFRDLKISFKFADMQNGVNLIRNTEQIVSIWNCFGIVEGSSTTTLKQKSWVELLSQTFFIRLVHSYSIFHSKYFALICLKEEENVCQLILIVYAYFFCVLFRHFTCEFFIFTNANFYQVKYYTCLCLCKQSKLNISQHCLNDIINSNVNNNNNNAY